MRKAPYGLSLIGVVLLAVGLLLAAGSRSQSNARHLELLNNARNEASAFSAYLDRARSMDLLLAQNTTFRSALSSPAELTEANRALRYLEVLYPDVIGEACLIDDSGHELARVVEGVPAAQDELSDDESGNPFFAPTLARPLGTVYQASPYRSPDIHTWVISNSTWIPRPGGGRLIVHFEVTLESFRPYVQPSADGHGAVVDGSGAVLIRDGVPLPSGETFPANGWSRRLAGSRGETGGLSVEGHTGAFFRVGRSAGGAPDWYAVVWSAGSASTLPEAYGEVVALLGLLSVLLGLWLLRRQNAAAHAASRKDYLTGLGNRKALEETLVAALSNEGSGHDRVGVLLLDLDGFKQINDSLGHDQGDLVLQEISRRLQSNVLEHDMAARLGGDEFAVLLRRLKHPEDIEAVAMRIRESLLRPILLDDVPRLIGVSIGGSLYPDHGLTATDLLRNADASMFAAKRGREGFRLYDPGTDDGVGEMGLAAELLSAIEYERITLAYQPEYSPDGERIVGVEALARWTAASGQAVPPDRFVLLAEQTGLIRSLTSATLRLALDAARLWREDGVQIPVSVNLSAAVVGDRTLLPEILELLAERHLPTSALVLEVTETSVIGNRSAAVDVLEALRTLGVRIELDDFGSGNASFTALRDLPLDAVKIDRDLVASEISAGGKLLAALVEMAHSVNLLVIAEGIEDAAALAVVARLGCDAVQGYHLARPMPLDQLRELLGQPATV